MSVLDEIEKFEKTIGVDATTIMLYEDVYDYIINGGYCIPQEQLPDIINTREFKERVADHCYTYNFDWSYGIGYEDTQDIVDGVLEEFGYKFDFENEEVRRIEEDV